MEETAKDSASLAALAASAPARRLVAVRLVGQLADGVLQGALAGIVLLSPERAATASGVAAAAAVLLLPFTLVGPWVGPLVDAVSRRQVLVVAGAVRAVLALLCALAVLTAPTAVVLVGALAYLSVTRLLLAALSASLPRVVAARDLVAANAVVPTAGSAAALVGGSAAVAGHAVLDGALGGGGAAGDRVDAVLLVVAAVAAAAAGALALRLRRDVLGPDRSPATAHDQGRAPLASGDGSPEPVRTRRAWTASVRATGSDLAAAVAHLRQRREAGLALVLVTVDRFGYGVVLVAALLLARNHLGLGLAAAAGLVGTLLAVSGAGFAAAAALTPVVVARLGRRRWAAACLLLAAAPPVALSLAPRAAVLVTGAAVLGLAAQGLKIVVDTVVQSGVDDAFRGRVFVLYDVLFNLAVVAAAGVSALVLPDDGHSPAVLLALAAGWVALAAVVARTGGRPVVRRAPSR